jgi:omega-amidase
VRDLTITLLQTELHWHDPAANRAMFTELVTKHAGDSDLIVLPETFSTGFTMASADNHEALDGTTVSWLKSLAIDTGTAVCGSLIVSAAGQYFNRLLCAQPDGQLHSYNKRHLFHMGGEDKNFSPGQERVIFEINGWRICPMICYDLRFPVWSRNHNEYDLLLYVANWPAARKSAWETLLPARAVENLCYAAGVNRTGVDGNGVEYAGGSQIADYLGNVTTAGTEITALTATLDGAKLERYREKFPAWKDADEFELKGTLE